MKPWVPEVEEHEANAKKPLLTLGEYLAAKWRQGKASAAPLGGTKDEAAPLTQTASGV